MQKIFKIFLTVSVVVLVGCMEFPNPFDGDRVLARVGKLTLRQMEVEAAFPGGVTGEDSLRWAESYVDRWVRDNLKLQEADRLFGSDEADEELVQNYRNSLKTRRLDQHYVNLHQDSLYTEDDLRDYYNQHKSEFVLDRTLVKGRVVALPSSFRQQKRVKELVRTFSADNRRDLQALAEKNGFVLREVSEWTEYPQFLVLLPTRRNASYNSLLSKEGVQEMKDGGVTYYFVIEEALTEGMTTPYEMVRTMVRWAVATRRKAEIVRSFEDSLYNSALVEKKAVIHLPKAEK
ncbi:MAG: hypothetical protein LBM63_01645 [Rikenellaceae bacterium]|jgi:hypothetical protein|nr:hypothetical protein [Rikenellaceae bacterium]